MNILCTGGAGFLGSNLCEELMKGKNNIFCLDDLNDYYDPQLKVSNLVDTGVDFVECDILNAQHLFSVADDFHPEVIVHLAAQPGVRISVEDPVRTHDVNTRGTLNVLEVAKKLKCRKVVFASSSSVYGDKSLIQSEQPSLETDVLNPISPYGVSKMMCEHYLRVYHELYGLEYVALRYFTVYGPRIRPDLAVSKFIKSAYANEPIQIYGDGSKTRDYTYVGDVVDATIKSITYGSGVYNIGGGNLATVNQLANKIIDIVGSGSIEYIEDQLGDVNHTFSNTLKAEKELGWTPKTEFYEGLQKTVEWVTRNE